jgi:deoxyadenosine/deoxycytidine kinase
MKIFSIEGNIGSGKSTLINFLKESDIDVYYLPEPVDLWNEIKDSSGVTILEKYYQDQKKYAFSFQMMAYISRISQIKSIKSDSIVITERCVFTDREIFAKMLYDKGLIEEIEYTIYLRWFDEFKVDIDGIIYLQTSPQTCDTRIKTRNRKGENIPIEYLTDCHEYHERWINSTDIPCLVLNNEQRNCFTSQIKEFVEKNIKI